MENNLTKVFIISGSSKDWKRIYNIVRLVNNVEVIRRSEENDGMLDSIRRSTPNLLIFDIDLPQGWSLGLLKQIHLEIPSLVIIVLSNNSTLQYRRIWAQEGAAYFFDKSTEFHRIAPLITGIRSNNNQLSKCHNEYV
ncbi:MAG: response regulator [Bacteroidota bacterium]